MKLEFLADHRDYNILLLAAEVGRTDVVELSLKFGVKAESENPTITAQSLAWEGRHSDVLIILAKANLPYPEGIEIEELSEEFKIFYKDTEDLHEAIINGNIEQVNNILQNNHHNLKFFLTLSNESAAKIAVNYKMLAIYEKLMAANIFYAPHEKKGAFSDCSKTTRQKVNKIHDKYSREIPNKLITILMAHSSISNYVSDHEEKLGHVKRTYEFLSSFSCFNIILKIIATSKKLKVIFDFDSDTVDFADPMSNEYTDGKFYLSGKIYIAAKFLLDEAKKNIVYGVIMHEFCHFALILVYGNMAKPYYSRDKIRKKEFRKIFRECKKNRKDDTLVQIVYEQYPKEIQEAELIVRPAHLMAFHHNNPEKIENLQKSYPTLFEYFQNILLPDMSKSEKEKTLWEHKEREGDRMKIERLRKEKKRIKCFYLLFILLIILLVLFIIKNEILNGIEIIKASDLNLFRLATFLGT